MKAEGPPSTGSGVAVEKVGLAPQILDIDGFIARVEPFFKENGFYEKNRAVQRTIWQQRPCLEYSDCTALPTRRNANRAIDCLS